MSKNDIFITRICHNEFDFEKSGRSWYFILFLSYTLLEWIEGPSKYIWNVLLFEFIGIFFEPENVSTFSNCSESLLMLKVIKIWNEQKLGVVWRKKIIITSKIARFIYCRSLRIMFQIKLNHMFNMSAVNFWYCAIALLYKISWILALVKKTFSWFHISYQPCIVTFVFISVIVYFVEFILSKWNMIQ